jgi:ElaB/YqjD/DUF883 family membrane-anchored ribosome-binding protein
MDRVTAALRARLVAEVQRLQQQIDEIDRRAGDRGADRTAALRANFDALLRTRMALTDENVRRRSVALQEFVGLCQNYDDVRALYHVVEAFIVEQPGYVNQNNYLGDLLGSIEQMFDEFRHRN